MAKPETTLEETPEDAGQRAAVQAGITSLDAGRSIPYEDVRKWLLSWGTTDEQPAPKCP